MSEAVTVRKPSFLSCCIGGDCASKDVNGVSSSCGGQIVRVSTVFSVVTLQTRTSRNSDILLYDYDCYKSLYDGQVAQISGCVTAVNDHGFYLQETSKKWAGIFVRTSTWSPLTKALVVGVNLRVEGLVNERLGTTQIEADDLDITVLADTITVKPLPTILSDFGSTLEERSENTGCEMTAEPYESLLVTFRNVTFFQDDFGLAFVTENDDYRGYLLHRGHLTAHLCEKCDVSGVRAAKLTGVATTFEDCPSPYTYFQCFSWNQFRFGFALLTRDAHDIRGVVNGENVVMTSKKTISDIQIRFSNETFCGSPSLLEHSYVTFEATVTAIDASGFFCQDGVAPFSGIYVLFENSVAIGDNLKISGVVAELRGQTAIKAEIVENSGDNVITPLELVTGPGTYSSTKCDAFNERYESLFVEFKNVKFLSGKCQDCFGALKFETDSNTFGLLDSHFDNGIFADILEREGSVRADIRGILRYSYECEHKADPLYCFEGHASFHYAFVLSPRSSEDLTFLPGGLSLLALLDDDKVGDDDDQERPLALFVLTTLAAMLLGLLMALCLLYQRNRRLTLRRLRNMISAHELVEMPLAEALEIQYVRFFLLHDFFNLGKRIAKSSRPTTPIVRQHQHIIHCRGSFRRRQHKAPLHRRRESHPPPMSSSILHNIIIVL